MVTAKAQTLLLAGVPRFSQSMLYTQVHFHRDAPMTRTTLLPPNIRCIRTLAPCQTGSML